jgi:hypothetical protein
MPLTLRPYLTTGVVIIGAGTLVAAPLTISPSAMNPPPVSVAVAPAAFADNLLGQFDSMFTNSGLTAEAALTHAGEVPGDIGEALGGSNLPDGVDVLTHDSALVGVKLGEMAEFLGRDVGDLPAVFADLAHDIAEDPANAPALIMKTVMDTMTLFGNDVFGPIVCILTENELLPPEFEAQIVQAVQKSTAALQTLESSLPALPRLPLPSHAAQTQVVNNSFVDPSSGPLSSPVIPNFVHQPSPDPVEEESDAPVTTRPRLNVLKINPLANSGEQSTVGSPNSGDSSAPRPGIVAPVIQKLTHPTQLGSIVRNILKPHEKQDTSTPPSDPTSN